MLWSLAHFGLELSDPESIVKASVVEVTKTVPDEVLPDSRPDMLLNTPADPRLIGPSVEDTLLNTMGHIVLAVPVARPECLDQIVEEINKRRPLLHPLRRFGKKKSISFTFDTGNPDDEIYANPEDIYQALQNKPEVVVTGTPWTEHHIVTKPSNMMLKVLPVPCMYATSKNQLWSKLNSIIRINNQLKECLNEPHVPELLMKDFIDMLSYHVMTYLDNAISGVPSDDSLNGGIAQILGEYHVFKEDAVPTDLGGTTLQRIVRGINMGESVLNVNAKDGEDKSLAFELQKQVVFNRVWKASSGKTQIVHINNFGEIQHMHVGLIEDLTWHPWDGETSFDREVVVAPRFSAQLLSPQLPNSLSNRIAKLQEVDNSYKPNLPEIQALSYLYSLVEQSDEVIEQQIVVCDALMNPLLLRPILRELKQGLETGVNVCILLTEMRHADANGYSYTPTPDDYRNLVIALTELRERPQFEHKEKMFQHLRETDLALLSSYVKGLSRKEMTQLLGEVILAKGKLDLDYAKACIGEHLLRRDRSVDHLNPKHVRKKRKLTLESLYHDEVDYPDSASPSSDDKSEEEENEEGEQSQDESLYASLKGLEPLTNWAKLTGKRFTPAAAEYGFPGYPKGLLLTGVPGCGKTMAAKIIAEEWKMKLHRVNPDDIQSKFVGGNEENIREVLNGLVEDAPSICFVDEAEKLFSQMTDEMTSAATVGQTSTESILLQFMEENTHPVFFIFTANDLEKMSPALIDRFDARFFVDLPDEFARREIITLMLSERKKGKLGIDIEYLGNISENYTGRDIRAAIDSAMASAFGDNGRELTQEDLNHAFETTKPTSQVHEKKIAMIRKMVEEGKIRSANSPKVVFNKAKSTHDVSFV